MYIPLLTYVGIETVDGLPNLCPDCDIVFEVLSFTAVESIFGDICCCSQVHECPRMTSCKYEGRESKLRDYQRINVTDGSLAVSEIEDYQNLMCTEGYTGNLCASCEEGYGTQSDAECAVCPDKYRNHFYYFCQSLINIAMVRNITTPPR